MCKFSWKLWRISNPLRRFLLARTNPQWISSDLNSINKFNQRSTVIMPFCYTTQFCLWARNYSNLMRAVVWGKTRASVYWAVLKGLIGPSFTSLMIFVSQPVGQRGSAMAERHYRLVISTPRRFRKRHAKSALSFLRTPTNPTSLT